MSATDGELDRLLALWAAEHRLTHAQVGDLRARVVATLDADRSEALDPDWLWRLLRPLTALLDGLDDERPPDAPRRARAWTTYLQLA